MSEPSTPQSDPTPPVPERSPVQPRIGDADRDRAVGYLQEHLAQGRLDSSEFDDRMERALRAKTAAEIDPLFHDLPEPRPGKELTPTAGFTAPPWQASQAVTPAAAPAPVPVESNGEPPRALIAVSGVIWPITILAITFLFGWEHFWWLVFIPIVVSSAMGKNHHDKERERERIEREQRRLDRRRRAIED